MNKKNIFIFIIIVILIIIFTIIIKSKIDNEVNKIEKTNTGNVSQKTDEEKKIENNIGQIVTTTNINDHNENLKKLLEKQKYENSIPQSEKEKIDEYNFGELEKVKTNLSNFQKGDYTIRNYLDYNRKYDPDIKPIKNCYYLSTENGKEPFIFGFKLESDKYKTKYGTGTYVYPKYDLPKDEMCGGITPQNIKPADWEGGCEDVNYDKFISVINNSCRGHISGYIYEDNNKNGIKDEGEKGIEGTVVTGMIGVKTDKDGYYSFGYIWGKREFKYINFPEGYSSVLTKIISLDIKKGEILENVNYGVYKR